MTKFHIKKLSLHSESFPSVHLAAYLEDNDQLLKELFVDFQLENLSKFSTVENSALLFNNESLKLKRQFEHFLNNETK